MALNLTDNWQMAKILTDNWHLYPPIQTLMFSSGLQFTQRWFSVNSALGKNVRSYSNC